MAISYDTVHQSGGFKLSSALQNMKSMNESFQMEGLNVFNEGFTEVATNAHFFKDYVNKLSEGMDPQTAAQFETLADNTRAQLLQESSISGINPITALSLPMMRIAFPKTSIREGFPTEPVLQPKFKVTWFRPYMVDPDTNEKLFMPASIKAKRALFRLKSLTESDIAVGASGATKIDLLTPVGGSSTLGDEIDPNFRIVNVKFKALDANGANAVTVSVDCDLALDTNIDVVEGSVKGKHTDHTENSIRVFAKIDRRTGLMDVVGLGRELVSIKIQGYISSEANNRSTQVGFDITAEEKVIGTGHPIESPINIQQMTDTMAMYNIDSTVRTLEIMSTAMAQSVDLEGIEFLERKWALGLQFKTTFDVNPPSNFMLGQTAWREEMKIKIDNMVTRMMQSTNITQGSCVIFGNPLDTQVLHNVRWMFTGEEQVNGVNVEYRVGAYTSGISSYKVLSSFNFGQGEMFVVFLPAAPDQASIKYYPYSFNVIRGTTSPNHPYTPAVMLLKRHLFEQYNQMIGKIVIQNNDGQ